jgi:type I restriction enzyme S subunit
LLEGLEISIIKYSELEQTKRIDSEFVQKRFLQTEKLLKSQSHIFLESILVSITDGKHGGVDFKDNGVLFLRNTNIKANQIDLTDKRFISVEESSETIRAELSEDDILITTIGSIIGESVVVPKGFPRATINQNLVKIVLQDKHMACYISSLLNSTYGSSQIYKYATGNIWLLVNYPNLKKLIIPLFSDSFYAEITEVHDRANYYLNKSKALYIQAENLLLQEIGLIDFTPSRETLNIKRYKESFGVTGRIDAEYYQPKYEQVIETVKQKSHDVLGSLVHITKSIEPGSDAYAEVGLPFLRVSDYNKYGMREAEKKLSKHFCTENALDIAALKPHKGTILFSKDGTLGIAYLLRENLDAVTSSAILHLSILDTKKLIPEYLTLVLNSSIVQMQAERDSGGSIIVHWRIAEIKEVVIPIIDIDKQKEIANLVEESFKLKKQSEKLLDTAKRAVEIAIEQSEAAALKFISRNS